MRNQTTIQRLGLGAAFFAVLTLAEPAQAFYWRGWPGSGVIVAPLLVDPNDRTPGNPPVDPIPPPGSENEYIPPVGPPESVPEPATALAGLLGLGAVAVMRRLRKSAT